MARRKARELAFRTLFEAERGGVPVLEVWDQVRADIAEVDEEGAEAYGEVLDREGIEFAGRLVGAYSAHREEVDAKLADAVEGWSFGQMNQTDLNVLRLALTELLYEPDIPRKVTIEMAVRSAKKFGGEESGRFVNGVLAKLYGIRKADAGEG